MIVKNFPSQTSLEKAMTRAYRIDETEALNYLIPQATLSADSLKRIHDTALSLVQKTRIERKKLGGLDTFLSQYDLSSEEGIALMCLAEALLRIPDKATIDTMISDKISTSDWQQHLFTSPSLFVNAATWSLLLTGKIYSPNLSYEKSLGNSLKKLFTRASGIVIRPAIMHGMKIIGKQFVMGQTIEEAVERAKELEATGYRYSYDMLGEAARTAEDAEQFFHSYVHAIDVIGKISNGLGPVKSPGISIKLSALHPRYEYAQRTRVFNELIPRVLALAMQAKKYNINLTIDAEEADRLQLSLEIFEQVFSHPELNGWMGFGLAVQSYQKRAPFVLDWLINLAEKHERRIMVRLIKGAYWDAEIKQSQMLGLDNYPVYTRKHTTDVSFIACAKKMLANTKYIYSQFGTHNAYSVAAIIEMAGNFRDFEFQCLHGMGQVLYNNIVGKDNLNIPCRIYAPVGSHKNLLGYLIRRLLENGANTSFINRLADETLPIEDLIINPVERIAKLDQKPHPKIPLPKNIFGATRLNSSGIDLSNLDVITDLKKKTDALAEKSWQAGPIISGKMQTSSSKDVRSPYQSSQIVGHVSAATANDVTTALEKSAAANWSWSTTPVNIRAAILERAADLLENSKEIFISLLSREGGKQIVDCISEIREAVDFCRYYAAQARIDLIPKVLQGPTGEFDQFTLLARGTIVCISPWNFPLAIFLGQIVAALVCGNTVIAKPAEQTPLVAAEAIKLLHEAGIPEDALHLLTGEGARIGGQLVADERVAGVMFTGSTETAKIIQQTLANRKGPIVPFIAETGGLNAMLVDSTALPEQVVMDILNSAFNSAGQRCSALRVAFIQEDIADKILEMLQGAMAELTIGDPTLLSTDVGPVIDDDALQMLNQHFTKMSAEAKLIYQIPLPKNLSGSFFAPCVFELKKLNVLKREVFGPFLHIIRYATSELDEVLEDIRNTGYGLTFGIHSRIESKVNYILDRMPIGNLYVNRNIIGAVVGVQPFGGEGLSGTGPKAGGIYYLPRLCVERALSINTTAAGGNTTLVSLSEENSD